MEVSMTQIAHATESHITAIEKVIYTAKAHTAGSKGGPSMTKLALATTSRCLFVGLLVFALSTAPNAWAQTRPPILEKMAKTYGLDSWDQIQAIRYTWNLQLGALNISRSWEWEPKTGKVSYEGKDKDGKPVKATYLRSELGSQPDTVKNEIDPAFINDNYTLLFPLKAYWDSSATVIDQGMYNLPVGNGSAELVAVKYPAESGGYTPGDTWELYVGKDNRAEYLVYHRGGTKKPSILFATWGGHKKAGPLLFSTDHRGNADGKPIRVFFSDLSVKVTGSDTWVNAK
jgi:hypothetical protein